MDKERLAEEVKKKLSPQRFEYSMCVAQEAVKLANHYGVDGEELELAGILHDIMKETPVDEQLQTIGEFGIILDNVERQSPKLLHAISATAYIQKELKITSPNILSAVRYHTTAKADMTMQEKILYIADYISADRQYRGVDYMRKWAYECIDHAILEGLAYTIDELVKRGNLIHTDTINAYNQLILQGVGNGIPPQIFKEG